MPARAPLPILDFDACFDFFSPQTGGYLNTGTVRQAFNQALKAAGLPHVRIHDLRHMAATYLLSLGTHPRIVQELLGHSTIGLTMDTYSDVLEGLHKGVAAEMERFTSASG